MVQLKAGTINDEIFGPNIYSSCLEFLQSEPILALAVMFLNPEVTDILNARDCYQKDGDPSLL